MQRTFLIASLATSLALVGCSKNDQANGESAKPAEPAAATGPEHGGQTAPPAANPHAGVAGAPSGAMPSMGAPAAKLAPTSADGTKDFGPFTMKVPEAWNETAPTSSMRAAQWEIPGDAGAGELVVYYFGESGAGGVDANLTRWYGQFSQPDGKDTAAVAKTDKKEIAGMPVTTVFVTGRYVASVMPGAGGGAKHDEADYAMLGAIVESEKGPYYFKLVGPKATLEASRESFNAFVDSLAAK